MRGAERFDRRCVEDDFSFERVALRGRQRVDQPPGKNVHQLNVRIADDEAPCVAHGNRHLQRVSMTRSCAGDDFGHVVHSRLHGDPACRGTGAVVAVDPAGDCIAAEVDDVTAVAIELLDERIEDAIQVEGQALRASLGAELQRQRLGERGETGDVGEQCRPADAVGHVDPGGERASAVAGNVRLEVVECVG